MTPFTKRELQTQINNIHTRIALLKLPTVTNEEAERIQAEREKLDAARNELLEKLKVAPE
jgi:ribosome-binding protein aMBF1 (putative translation factor)